MAEAKTARLLSANNFGEDRVKDVLAAGKGVLTEVRSGRWRPMKAGATVVFVASDRFSEPRFLGTAVLDGELVDETLGDEDVAGERVIEGQRSGLVRSTYVLSHAAWFQGGAILLDPFVFSLVQVSNFTRPLLNMRHRAYFPDIDVETLRTGQIDGPRSTAYGLLRGLPSYWRDLIEVRAHYEVDSRLPGSDFFPERILSLVQRIAVAPTVLAQHVDGALERLGFGQRSVEAIVPSAARQWNVTRLLRRSRQLENLVETWRAILPLARREGALQRQWRPHHW